MNVENNHTAEAECERTKDGNETFTVQTYLGDEDEDVHKCGRCQLEFSTLESFIQHKLHQSCKRVDNVTDISQHVQDQELEASRVNMSAEEDVVPAESSSESVTTNANGDICSQLDECHSQTSLKTTKESTSGKVDKHVFKVDQDGRYLCQLCQKTFKTSNILRTHLKTHSDQKNFSCELCETSFRTKGSLIRHNRRHTDERPYRCNLCGISFRESGALTRHRKSRTPCTEKIRFVQYKEILVSKDGQQKGVNSSQAEQQEVIVLEELSEDETAAAQTAVVNLVEAGSPEVIHQVHFTMEVDGTSQEQQVVVESAQAETLAAAVGDNLICQAIINSGLALKEEEGADHQMEEISVMVEDCPDAEETEIQIKEEFVESKAEDAKNTLSPSKPYVCPHCGRSFKGLNYFRFHVSGHAGKPFKCNICQRDFQTGYLLRKHMENHGAERRYKCGECGKLYKTIGHIREHMRCHSDVRPYHCTRCNKDYKTKNALQVHQRIHGEEKPYQCQYCPRGFREKGSLVRHIRHHTGEKPFKCPKCGRGFAEHGTLNRHMRAKGGCRKEESSKHAAATEEVVEEVPGDSVATAAIISDDPNAVLVEFSSVVADTQEYIIDTQSEEVQVESQSEMSSQIVKVVQQLVSQSHSGGSHQIIVRNASLNEEGASISDCGDTITIATPQNLTEQVAMTLVTAIGDGTLLTTTETEEGTIAMVTAEDRMQEDVQVVQEEYVIANPEVEIQTVIV
ncbi:transcription factor E4F1 [Synchiropus picturatus]